MAVDLLMVGREHRELCQGIVALEAVRLSVVGNVREEGRQGVRKEGSSQLSSIVPLHPGSRSLQHREPQWSAEGEVVGQHRPSGMEWVSISGGLLCAIHCVAFTSNLRQGACRFAH